MSTRIVVAVRNIGYVLTMSRKSAGRSIIRY